MELTLLAKDASSGRDGCPSVYLGGSGKLVIQGELVDSATRANLHNLLTGEGAVEIDVDIVQRALAQLV